jgi:6-phosphofructokinase 1
MSAAEALKGNVVIGQSGGPTAVINQSLVGVVETLKGHDQIGTIFGARHGVRGIIEDQLIELQDVPQEKLDRVAQTPSAALGSTRDKPDKTYCEEIFKHLEKHNVRYFFYIGGNDSSDTCRIVNELSNEAGYELRCFHVPKTIDNDLMESDHTPGFGSAAKVVAQAFTGDNLDNKALPGVKINVIMGRHAGFLAAASMLARRQEGDGPHLIYVPEVAFNEEKFLTKVDEIYKKHGRCLIACSEGIHDDENVPMAIKLAVEQEHQVERDAHGNVQLSGTGALGDFLGQLVKTKLNIKRVRADTFGYFQRSLAGVVSETDAREARGVGRKAGEIALQGDYDGSIAIVRLSDKPYESTFKRIELTDVAAKTRTLDPKYIVDGCDIDDSFRTYLDPIVGQMPVVDNLF